MSNVIAHAGHEPPYASSPVGWSTTAGDFNADRSRSAISAKSISSALNAYFTSTVTDFGSNDLSGYWLHALVIKSSTTTYAGYPVLNVADSSGNYSASIIAGNSVSTAKLRLFSGSGTSYTEGNITGTNDANWLTTLTQIDVHCWTSGGTSYAAVYLDGSLTPACTVSRSSDTNRGANLVRLGNANLSDSVTCHWSEMILANFDTRNRVVYTLPPTGNGTYTDTTGTYENIDEVTADANYAEIGSAGDALTMTAGLPSGSLSIDGIVCGMTALTNGSTTIKNRIRSNGGNHDSSAVITATTLTAGTVVYMTDPGTSLPFVGDLSSLEFGFVGEAV